MGRDRILLKQPMLAGLLLIGLAVPGQAHQGDDLQNGITQGGSRQKSAQTKTDAAIGRDSGAGNPISAIDWLSALNAAGIGVRPGLVPMVTPGAPQEPPVTNNAATPSVSSAPLGAVQAGAVGLLPGSVTGLPPSLWQGSDADLLADEISKLDVTSSPAMQSLLYTLLLAEVDPPQDATGARNDALLLARIAKLRSLGAVEPALALLERAGPTRDPRLFASWFDLSLLNGTENAACKQIATDPALAPDQGARIFCLARGDDWDTAALLLDSARALDTLPPEELHLLNRFLDVTTDEDAVPLPPPSEVTPLLFRLSEAIGEPMATASLPRAFAVSDLRGLAGWKAELDAAERLARTGALPENRLLGIFSDGRPSASGGVWDRVAALQAFDRAMQASDNGKQDAAKRIAATLPNAWQAMTESRLEVPFARLYGARLTDYASLPGRPGRIAAQAALLAPGFEKAAPRIKTDDPRMAFVVALAQGKPGSVPAPDNTAQAIAAGFAPDAQPPEQLMRLVQQGRLGEAILYAMDLYLSAAQGEWHEATAALATFRAVGLEETARQAGIQLMLLNARG